MSPLIAADVMTECPVSVSPRESALDALSSMREHGIRHLLVVDEEGELLGVLSDRDLRGIPFVVFDRQDPEDEELARSLRDTTVDELYTRNPETISADTPLAEAGRLLVENKFGCLPVTSGAQVVGILTEADFVKLVVRSVSDAGAAPPLQL